MLGEVKSINSIYDRYKTIYPDDSPIPIHQVWSIVKDELGLRYRRPDIRPV
jgi:hypothetical protein